MTTQEGLGALGLGTAARQLHNRAYFLDRLGDSHNGLGCYEAAIVAYRQATQEFEARGARCSYALCLFKIADSYLSLHEPWHAIGYLTACLPLLRELGLVRHEGLALHRLAACQAELALAYLPGQPRRFTGSTPPPQAARSAAPARAARSAAPARAARLAALLPGRR